MLGRGRSNPDGVFTTALVLPSGRIASVGADNVLVQSLPRERAPFTLSATPHGTSR